MAFESIPTIIIGIILIVIGIKLNINAPVVNLVRIGLILIGIVILGYGLFALTYLIES